MPVLHNLSGSFERKALHYGFAALLVALGLIVRWPFWEKLEGQAPYLTFFPAVVLSAWRGGLGPGIFSTFLSAIAALCFVPNALNFNNPTDLTAPVRLLLFLGTGIFISWFAQQMQNARAAEHQQRHLSELTLAGIGDGVIAINNSGRVTYLNSAAAILTGWDLQTARDLPIEQVFHVVDEDIGEAIGNPLHALQHEVTQHFRSDCTLVGKDGRSVALEVSAAPIRDTDGRTIGAVLIFRDISQRRQAERDLVESRERLRFTLESITDGFIALDPDRQVVYANAEAKRLLGKNESAPLTEELLVAFMDRDEIAKREYTRALDLRMPVQFETYDPEMDAWFDVKAYPVASGGLSIYLRDITKRKKTEEALAASRLETEQSRDLLQITLASIGDAVIVTDEHSRATFLNPVAASLTGWDIEAAIGRPLSEIFAVVNEISGNPIENPADRILRDGSTIGLTHRTILVAKDGRKIPIDDSVAPIRDPEGRIRGVVLVFRDVTGRRAAEDAIQASEERLRLALHAGQVGVWDWDIRLDRVEWSERVYEIHGVKPGEFSGKVEDFTRLIHPEDQTRVSQAIRNALEHRAPYDIEFRVVHPNGEIHWITTTAQVLYDSEYKPIRMLGATTDITEQKRIAEQLKQQTEDLARSNADLERFAFAASHDLQEPLRTITIYSQLLGRKYKGELDAEASQFLNFIIGGTERMRLLVTDLLSYSRAVHEAPAVAPVDCAGILDQVLQNCQAAITEVGASVSASDLPVVAAEESQVVQLFQNLITNSLKYRSGDPPKIHIAATKQDDKWMFSVQDNGIGIEPRYHKRVFELFQRLSPKSPGTGVGLALCQRIVERYGGRIWVESELGQGATFYFTLPHAESNAASSKVVAASGSIDTDARQQS